MSSAQTKDEKNGSLLTIFSDYGCIGRMPVNEENRRFFEYALRLSESIIL